MKSAELFIKICGVDYKIVNKQESRFHVTLHYSSDNVNDREAKRINLLEGGDRLTSLLKEKGVDFSVELFSDFWDAEPILNKVNKEGADGKVYELFNEYGQSRISSISGFHVTRYLTELGVI